MGAFLLPFVALSTGPWAIAPGMRVGHVSLGETLSAVKEDLGEPEESDAALGHVWVTWRSSTGRTVSIYAVRGEDDMEPRVQIVRITSPSFSVKSHLRVGASLSKTVKWIGGASKVDAFQQGQFRTELWDNVRAGLAVEIRDGKCSAIAIHAKGTPLLPIYSPYPLGRF